MRKLGAMVWRVSGVALGAGGAQRLRRERAVGVGVFVKASDTSLTPVRGDFALLAGNVVRVEGSISVTRVSDTLVREQCQSDTVDQVPRTSSRRRGGR